jgi:hypothetical protein
MKAQDERRNPAVVDDEPLSPELIALLVMCGAEVRAADRALVEAANEPDAPERRRPERRRPAAG